jgi:hypothetical protein
MTDTPLVETREDVSRRLLASSETLSFDPAVEIDWDAPLDPALFGLNPEWSTLYGTPMWETMTHEQRVTLTRHEVCSIMSTGIWFEMILQQMVLRDQYVKDPTNAEFRFALTEIADECRHSIMFARACEKMGAPAYFPDRISVELARAFKTTANAEVAYGGILVAEEMLDVMQRDWMSGENVLPLVRETSRIHVVEESRHMKFARQEIQESLAGASAHRKARSGTVIAVVAHVILRNMVNKRVYAAAGLDTAEALRQVRQNQHRKSMLRTSGVHLMAFLGQTGLLPKPATAIYRHDNML